MTEAEKIREIIKLINKPELIKFIDIWHWWGKQTSIIEVLGKRYHPERVEDFFRVLEIERKELFYEHCQEWQRVAKIKKDTTIIPTSGEIEENIRRIYF